MKITVQFESLEEFQKFVVAADQLEDEKKARAASAAKKAESVPEPKQAEEIAKGAVDAMDDVIQAKEEKKAKAEKPKAVDYDALRVECRKVLAELNKVTGKNTASEMIKSHGAEKLTQVEDEFLEELLAEAKEALSDAK